MNAAQTQSALYLLGLLCEFGWFAAHVFQTFNKNHRPAVTRLTALALGVFGSCLLMVLGHIDKNSLLTLGQFFFLLIVIISFRHDLKYR